MRGLRLLFTLGLRWGYSRQVMIDSDNILAGEISRQRPDRTVKSFNEGYVVVGSDETNDAVCVMTAIGMPARERHLTLIPGKPRHSSSMKAYSRFIRTIKPSPAIQVT